MGRGTDWLLALAAGALLAVMIEINSVLALHSTPLYASWVSHGVGVLAALALVFAATRLFRGRALPAGGGMRLAGPAWAYLGGVPGAMTVVLASITVNSALGLAATLALMLVGQVIFGFISDAFGLFGVAKRRFTVNDLIVILCVLAGSALIIFFRT